MKNPIAKNEMFATPANAEDFYYLTQFSGSERVIAITVAQMALNFASAAFDTTIARADDSTDCPCYEG